MAIFLCALSVYLVSGFHWVWFLVLLFLFDVSMVGYLWNNKAGALLYNVGHSVVLPLLFLAWGFARGMPMMLAFGCIWVAHIGMDRALGYGLKFETSFKETHLGSIGRRH